jgi:DNA polymerase elongation subunit (family B)
LTGKEALRVAKELTVESGKLVSSCLKPPHDFEFDKIFRSFILLSKKRYVGDMSEDGIEDEDFHRKSMGIVMKRRDNAPIVKYVYGNVVDKILNSTSVDESIKEATRFVQTASKELLEGRFPLSKLTITKSLRANYADPLRIAHKVLADRIGERDPGNKPSTSDRIPFVYISHGAGPAPKLQGDRIELPSYIKEHGLMPDYAFYITNQIAKPVSQVFGLAVESMPGVSAAALSKTARTPKAVKAREKHAASLLFDKVLIAAARRPEAMEAKGQRSIASMFAVSKKPTA